MVKAPRGALNNPLREVPGVSLSRTWSHESLLSSSRITHPSAIFRPSLPPEEGGITASTKGKPTRHTKKVEGRITERGLCIAKALPFGPGRSPPLVMRNLSNPNPGWTSNPRPLIAVEPGVGVQPSSFLVGGDPWVGVGAALKTWWSERGVWGWRLENGL